MWTPKRLFGLYAVAVLVSVFLVDRYLEQRADALYINGTLYTMDDRTPRTEAMAVMGDRIVGIGSTEMILRKFRAPVVVDLKGRTVLPGFIDAHAHLMSLGLARMTVDLLGTTSEQQAVERVHRAAAAAQPDMWIRGRGWDQNDWPSKTFPVAQLLDKVSKSNPVILSRVDGHAVWVNTRAMELAGVTKETKDPEGGRIVRDRSGNPTGIFIDNAELLIVNAVPPPTEHEAQNALRLAMAECLGAGMTSVHDMGVDTFEINLYRRMIESDEFPMRVYAAIGGPVPAWEEFKRSGHLVGYGRNHLTVRSLKLYVDGALGSRGAALIEPYSDDPGNRGLTVTNDAEFRSTVREALDHGFQICTHAIGDRANHMTLDIYQELLQERPAGDYRLRVEHAQVLAAEDIPRFHELGVIPSMQLTHCTSDMYWAEARLGSSRVRGAYAWRSLLNTGVEIPGGSDFPVEQPFPLWGIYAAVTRRDKQGIPHSVADIAAGFDLSNTGIADSSTFADGWYGGEKMTREEAIRSFTIWAARSAFEENLKGSLETGKLADFIVLSEDIMTCAPDRILETRVERTFVGGKEISTRLFPVN